MIFSRKTNPMVVGETHHFRKPPYNALGVPKLYIYFRYRPRCPSSKKIPIIFDRLDLGDLRRPWVLNKAGCRWFGQRSIWKRPSYCVYLNLKETCRMYQLKSSFIVVQIIGVNANEILCKPLRLWSVISTWIDVYLSTILNISIALWTIGWASSKYLKQICRYAIQIEDFPHAWTWDFLSTHRHLR